MGLGDALCGLLRSPEREIAETYKRLGEIEAQRRQRETETRMLTLNEIFTKLAAVPSSFVGREMYIRFNVSNEEAGALYRELQERTGKNGDGEQIPPRPPQKLAPWEIPMPAVQPAMPQAPTSAFTYKVRDDADQIIIDFAHGGRLVLEVQPVVEWRKVT